VVLATGASFGQEVKTDYDRSTDFIQYKTYSWEKVQTQDPLWVDRIKEAVNASLTAKGWKQVQSGGNVAIVAIETTANPQTLDSFYNGFGGGAVDSETQQRPLKTIRLALWLSICSTQPARRSSGGDPRVTPFQTSRTRTSRIWTTV